MYRNLLAELARANITNSAVAKCINVNERTFRNKLNGIYDFRWQEVQKIQNTFFPALDLHYLFEKQPQAS